MSEKFQNRYRIPSARLQNWDYGCNAAYFITICTQSHVEKFHEISLSGTFEWQSRFYDHIIRNDESFQRITNYIVNNPLKWNNDKFFDTNNAINN